MITLPLYQVRSFLGVALIALAWRGIESSAAEVPGTARETTLHSFGPPAPPESTDLRDPFAPPILGSNDGVLYGITTAGPGPSAFGGVYRVGTDGEGYKVVYSFTSLEARGSSAALLEGEDDLLYGTAPSGGAARGGFGVLFRLDKLGITYTQLHVFTNTPDGANPAGPVVRSADGWLYGATDRGGAAKVGTLYRVRPSGEGYQVLHSFGVAPREGKRPPEAPIIGPDGMLYGVTYSGGENDLGVIYRIAPDGSSAAVLHSFGLPAGDGANPIGSLALFGDFFYGVTQAGGVQSQGTVFRLHPDGSGYEVVHRFLGGPSDGQRPYGSLVRGADGKLYGTTVAGGRWDVGTIYRFHPDTLSWELAWHFFRAIKTGDPLLGQFPQSGLVAGRSGEFYGATSGGGASGFGSIFRFHPQVALSVRKVAEDWVLEWPMNGLLAEIQSRGDLQEDTPWEPSGIISEQDGLVNRAIVPVEGRARYFRIFVP